MFNIGGGEVLVIMVLALVVLGPDKLPEAARTVGKHLADFRRISGGFRAEITNAMDLGAFTGAPASEPAPTTSNPATAVASSPADQPAPAPEAEPTVPTSSRPASEPTRPDRDLSSVGVWADGPVDSFV